MFIKKALRTLEIYNISISLNMIYNNVYDIAHIYFLIDDITVKAVPPVGTYLVMMEVEDPCTLSSTGGKAITINNRVSMSKSCI